MQSLFDVRRAPRHARNVRGDLRAPALQNRMNATSSDVFVFGHDLGRGFNFAGLKLLQPNAIAPGLRVPDQGRCIYRVVMRPAREFLEML